MSDNYTSSVVVQNGSVTVHTDCDNDEITTVWVAGSDDAAAAQIAILQQRILKLEQKLNQIKKPGTFEYAECQATQFVGNKVCPLDQCQVVAGEEDDDFYYVHFYQELTERGFTVKVSKTGSTEPVLG